VNRTSASLPPWTSRAEIDALLAGEPSDLLTGWVLAGRLLRAGVRASGLERGALARGLASTLGSGLSELEDGAEVLAAELDDLAGAADTTEGAGPVLALLVTRDDCESLVESSMEAMLRGGLASPELTRLSQMARARLGAVVRLVDQRVAPALESWRARLGTSASEHPLLASMRSSGANPWWLDLADPMFTSRLVG